MINLSQETEALAKRLAAAQSLTVEDAPIPPFARFAAPPGFFTTIISRTVLSRDIGFPENSPRCSAMGIVPR
jgi:hypothetical protein